MASYLGMVLADKMILQGDLVMGKEELQRERCEEVRKYKLLQLEVSVLRSQLSRDCAVT